MHFIISIPLTLSSLPVSLPLLPSSSQPIPFLTAHFMSLFICSLLTRSWIKGCLKGHGQLPATTCLKGSGCTNPFNQSIVNHSPVLFWAQLLGPRGKIPLGKWQEIARHRETKTQLANTWWLPNYNADEPGKDSFKKRHSSNRKSRRCTRHWLHKEIISLWDSSEKWLGLPTPFEKAEGSMAS